MHKMSFKKTSNELFSEDTVFFRSSYRNIVTLILCYQCSSYSK